VDGVFKPLQNVEGGKFDRPVLSDAHPSTGSG
jgi:hypothetical protein